MKEKFEPSQRHLDTPAFDLEILTFRKLRVDSVEELFDYKYSKRSSEEIVAKKPSSDLGTPSSSKSLGSFDPISDEDVQEHFSFDKENKTKFGLETILEEKQNEEPASEYKENRSIGMLYEKYCSQLSISENDLTVSESVNRVLFANIEKVSASNMRQNSTNPVECDDSNIIIEKTNTIMSCTYEEVTQKKYYLAKPNNLDRTFSDCDSESCDILVQENSENTYLSPQLDENDLSFTQPSPNETPQPKLRAKIEKLIINPRTAKSDKPISVKTKEGNPRKSQRSKENKRSRNNNNNNNNKTNFVTLGEIYKMLLNLATDYISTTGLSPNWESVKILGKLFVRAVNIPSLVMSFTSVFCLFVSVGLLFYKPPCLTDYVLQYIPYYGKRRSAFETFYDKILFKLLSYYQMFFRGNDQSKCDLKNVLYLFLYRFVDGLTGAAFMSARMHRRKMASEVLDIFTDFQNRIIEEQKVEDEIITIVKRLEALALELVTALQVIHKFGVEAQIEAICEKTDQVIENDVKLCYKNLADVISNLPSSPYYKYHDHWHCVTQKIVFIVSLSYFLKTGKLTPLSEAAKIIGVESDRNAGFHLDLVDYLIGVLFLASELSRLAVNSVTYGNYERPVQISKFVTELNAGFTLLNLKKDYLRKRFDSLKYDMKKIEEVVYDLHIRGLIH